jgi:hypothetical protein
VISKLAFRRTGFARGGLFLASLVMATSCQAPAMMRPDASLMSSGQTPMTERVAAVPAAPAVAQLASAKGEATSVPLDRRVVVYTAAYRVVVAEVVAAIRETEQLAASFGGYVQSIDGDAITFRVPVARYNEATAEVEKLGTVVHRQMQAIDVTDEYVDLEARLKNATAVRARLEALLAKAEDVKAALEVERELKRLGEEIEQLQAKLELLKNRVAYSTIAVTFERVARTGPGLTRPVALPFDWLRELDPQRLLQTW